MSLPLYFNDSASAIVVTVIGKSKQPLAVNTRIVNVPRSPRGNGSLVRGQNQIRSHDPGRMVQGSRATWSPASEPMTIFSQTGCPSNHEERVATYPNRSGVISPLDRNDRRLSARRSVEHADYAPLQLRFQRRELPLMNDVRIVYEIERDVAGVLGQQDHRFVERVRVSSVINTLPLRPVISAMTASALASW
jgi:hypothetical protein